MPYSPSEAEKSSAALAQALAALFFFVPPWIVSRMKVGRRSRYVGYWTKVSMIWSVWTVFAIFGAVAARFWLDTSAPLVLVVVIHVIVCVMGAFASSFNVAFGYLFVAALFCPKEYAALRSRTLARPYHVEE